MPILSHRKALLLFCALAFVGVAVAQTGGGGITYGDGRTNSFLETIFEGRIVDSLTRAPLPSAVISIVSTNHHEQIVVRNYATDNQGLFQFKCYTGRNNRMEVSFLGYKLREVTLETNEPMRNLGDIYLVESPTGIDDVVIKTRIQMYKMKGDTIVFVPRAVKTMEGDKAIDILRHMPGVTVSSSGGIAIKGETVARTYVNNQMLFGENPTTALKQLAADEIASIMAYDEVDEQEQLLHGQNAKKRKVLNVLTFKKFTKSLTANALAEWGMDFAKAEDGKHPFRYQLAGDGGYYSAKLQVAAAASADNRTQTGGTELQPGSRRNIDGRVSVSGNVDQRHHYSTQYYYNNTRSENTKTTIRDYFPSEHFASQRTADSTRSEAQSQQHSLYARYNYQAEDWSIGTNLHTSFATKIGTNRLSQQTEQNDNPFLAMLRNNKSQEDALSLGGVVNLSKQYKNSNSLNINIQADHNNNKNLIHRQEIQNRSSDVFCSDLRFWMPAPITSVAGNVSYSIDFAEAGSLSFGPTISYSGTKERQIVTDRKTGLMDKALSEDVVDRSIAGSIGTGYRLVKGAHTMNFSLGYSLESRNYEDRLVDTPQEDHLFQRILGSVSYAFVAPKNMFHFSLSNSEQSPQMRELSSRINDTNPLALSSGNPSLRPVRNYNLTTTGEVMGKQSSLSWDINATLTTGAIATKYTYFEHATTLHNNNNYLALAGSTLSTPFNGGHSINVQASANYKTRIAPLKCFVEVGGQYLYLNSQSSIAEKLKRTQNHIGTIDAKFTSNFSSKVRILLSTTTEGRWYNNGFGGADKGLKERLSATVRWDFLDRCFISSLYAWELSRNTLRPANYDRHLLNITLGCRLLNRRGSITFNAYDVLNQNSSLQTTQNALSNNYVWQQVYGSYFTFAFEYKFNDRK